MLAQILTEEQEVLLAEERTLLGELETVLERLSASDDRRALAAAREELDTLFLVAVIAPSADAGALVADALLGERVLTVGEHRGPVRRVRRPRREGDGGGGAPARPAAATEEGSPEEVDLAVLERMELAVSAGVEPVEGLGRADLALVLTSARQPFAGAEGDLLRAAAERATRVMVVVDEMDMLRLSEDVHRMEEAVGVAARRILGRAVPVHGIATAGIDALPASAASLVPALARQIEATLRAPEITGPKLRRPAAMGRDRAARQRAALERSLEALGPDRENLETIDGALDSLEETAQGALREAVEEADRVLSDYGDSAGSFVHRWTRPFRLVGRAGLGRRFEEGPGGAARERLEAAAATLERTLHEAGERERRTIFEQLAARPTPRLEADPVDPAAVETAAPPEKAQERTVDELLRELDAEPTGRTLVGPLQRAALVSLGLFVIGVLFAGVAFLWSFGGGGGGSGDASRLLPAVLGGGLGGAAILAAVGSLNVARRRLVAVLAERVEARRATAAAALAALAEGWTGRAAARIRAPVAPYAAGVAREADRLEAARADCERLEAGLDDLLHRLGASAGQAVG